MFPIFRDSRVRRLDTGGIFSMRTLSVTTDSTNEEVTYNLCPRQFRSLPQGQFPMPNQPRKRVVDITIQCNGEQKKFTIPEDRSIITDNNIGLTISTDKQDIINILRNQYDTYKARKESIAKCDEEMSKCQILLDKLTAYQEQPKEDPKIKELQNEVNELKNIIKQASQMVPQPMKSMLPENMQNVMNEVDQ